MRQRGEKVPSIQQQHNKSSKQPYMERADTNLADPSSKHPVYLWLQLGPGQDVFTDVRVHRAPKYNNPASTTSYWHVAAHTGAHIVGQSLLPFELYCVISWKGTGTRPTIVGIEASQLPILQHLGFKCMPFSGSNTQLVLSVGVMYSNQVCWSSFPTCASDSGGNFAWVLLFPLLRYCLPLNKILNRWKGTDVRSLGPRVLWTCEVPIIVAYKDDGYDKFPLRLGLMVWVNH